MSKQITCPQLYAGKPFPALTTLPMILFILGDFSAVNVGVWLRPTSTLSSKGIGPQYFFDSGLVVSLSTSIFRGKRIYLI